MPTEFDCRCFKTPKTIETIRSISGASAAVVPNIRFLNLYGLCGNPKLILR